MNLAANGLDSTLETARALACSAPCKYAFYAAFFLIRGPTHLCLAPLVLREASWAVWTIRDAFRWMEAGVDEGPMEAVNRVRSIVGGAASVLLAAPQLASLPDDEQEEILARRLFQANVVLEAVIGLRLLVSKDFPSKVHRALALYVYFRIMVSGLSYHSNASSSSPLAIWKSFREQVEGRSGSVGVDDDEEDDEEEEEEGDDSDVEDDAKGEQQEWVKESVSTTTRKGGKETSTKSSIKSSGGTTVAGGGTGQSGGSGQKRGARERKAPRRK